MLQGAWFCLSGHYLDHWPILTFGSQDHEGFHRFTMMLGLYFILFAVGLFLLMFAVGWLAKRIAERLARATDLFDSMKDPLIQSEDETTTEYE